jgi:hypothetical protein
MGHRDLIAFWVRNDVLLVWKHGVHGLNLKLWTYHDPTQQLLLPLQPNWTTLPLLAQLNHYTFCLFHGGYGWC